MADPDTDPAVRAIARRSPQTRQRHTKGGSTQFFAGPHCRIMIVGQAPGRIAEETGIVTTAVATDCDWMGIDRDTFITRQPRRPMDFYSPGHWKAAATWHPASDSRRQVAPALAGTHAAPGGRSSLARTRPGRYLDLKSRPPHGRRARSATTCPRVFPLVHPPTATRCG